MNPPSTTLLRHWAPVALVLWLAMATAQAATYTYDAAGRLTGVDLGGGNRVGYGYDATGNITVLSTTSTQATLNVAAGSGGAVVLPTQAQSVVVADSPQPLLAEPAAGHAFVAWTLSGQGAVADPQAALTTVSIPANGTATVTATFAAHIQLTIDQATGGTLTPSGTTEVPLKKPTPITATPDEGWRFRQWRLVAGVAKFANRYAPETTVTLSADSTLTADFAPLTCRLEMGVHPLGAGTVAPGGISHPALDAAQGVTATAATGYTFAGWTASNAQAEFGDADAAATSVVLRRDTAVVANFAPDDVELTLRLATVGDGATSPAVGDHAVPFGQPQAITALGEAGRSFTGWTLAGAAVIANPHAAETTATLSGSATVTANFAADDDVARLVVGVLGDTGGVTVPTGGVNVALDSPGIVTLRAIPDQGHAFLSWEVVDGVDNVAIAAEAQADTVATVVGDAIVAARFTENAADHEGKLSIKLTLDGAKPGQDKAVLANLPLPVDLAFTETVSVHLDGIPFATDNGTWKTSGTPATGPVRTFKTAKGDARHQFTLTLDGRKQTWSLKASKATLTGIEPANGLDVVLAIGDETLANNYPLTAKTTWKYKRGEGNWTPLPPTLPGLVPFLVEAAGGKLDASKANADTITVSKGQLPVGLAFDPALDTAILSAGPVTAVLARQPTLWKTSGQSHQYKDPATGITAKLDFGKGLWSMKMSKVDASALAVFPEGVVDVRLAILGQEGAVRLEVVGKTILEYRAPKP